MAQPRRINLDEQAAVGSLTTIIIADGAVTSQKINVTAPLSFNGQEAVNFRVENVSSDPTPGSPGRLIWRTDIDELRIDDGTAFLSVGSGGGTSLTIEDEGTALPQRSTIDFVGDGVTATDTGTKIQISVPQGGHAIEDEGVSLPQRAILNFVGSGVGVTDDGSKTVVSVSGGSASYAQDSFVVTDPLDKTFTLSNTPTTNSQIVAWNGLVLTEGSSNDYTVAGNDVTLDAGITLSVGDQILVVYAF